MMENSPKNSLLGQLQQNGILKNDSEDGLLQHLPFGILTGNIDTIGPFQVEEPKQVESISEEIKETGEQKPEARIIKKRLNDLDGNIFQESRYLKIDDSELSTEEKIKKLKIMIDKINKKIFMLEDSDDELMLEKLKEEKDALQKALDILSSDNMEILNPSVLISKNPAVKEFTSKIHLKENIRQIENAVFKLFPVLKKNFLVRNALKKLIMLNENAKELITKKTPYGESEGRYNDFIAYLSCANVIHAKLTKKM